MPMPIDTGMKNYYNSTVDQPETYAAPAAHPASKTGFIGRLIQSGYKRTPSHAGSTQKPV